MKKNKLKQIKKTEPYALRERLRLKFVNVINLSIKKNK